MQTVLNYVSQFFSWLGSYTTLLSNNVVIATIVFLVIGIPLLTTVIRRYLL